MAKCVAEGLRLFEWPPEALAALEGLGAQGLAPPFVVMAGAESDESVHPFWFVRKYR